MKTVTAEEMRTLDEATIAAGISSYDLMEKAGVACAHEIDEFLATKSSRFTHKIHIFCGKGNNGGDGFVIANLLYQMGYRCKVWTLFDKLSYTPETKRHFENLNPLIPVQSQINNLSILPIHEVIIDCLLGTGVKGELKPIFVNLIATLNESKGLKIAIDLPSGLNGTTGRFSYGSFVADLTITIGRPKLGMNINERAAGLCGLQRTVDIGIIDDSNSDYNCSFDTLTDSDITSYLDRTSIYCHKGDMGKIVIIGGSDTYPGAPQLSAFCALRSGGGLVYLVHPGGIRHLINQVPNAIIKSPIGQSVNFGNIKLIKGDLEEYCFNKDFLAFGMGIGRHEDNKEILEFLLDVPIPLVLDADALYFVKDKQSLKKRQAVTILTPHAGEFKRLCQSLDCEEFLEKTKYEATQSFAKKFQCWLVLKGFQTWIATPSGEVFLSTSGGPALASGGSGDCLAGMIAAFGAQMNDVSKAICTAVYVHGRAATFHTLSQRAFIPDDIPQKLPAVLAELSPHS
ncbi:MAG: NAD(P)H-hydrate dehydratase [Lentisphaeria bacterium]|nr:NAD(P)H-hydrate dehydratase [Lentisphaeria bacterium]